MRNVPRTSSSILCVGVIGIVGAWAYTGYIAKTRFNGTENYAIGFPKSYPGWKVMPQTPESIFLFENPKKDMLIRGSVSQVIAEVNPTPDMTTDTVAQFYIDRTHENMHDWTAKRVPDLDGKNVRFSVIERQRKEHTVITAFAVKGNTTLMVSLSSPKGTPAVVGDAMTELKNYVKDVSLNLSDMGGGRTAALEASMVPVGAH